MSAAVRLAGPARAEAVAAVAGMTICALGGTRERRAQDHQRAPCPDRAGLPAAVDPDAGPRAHRVDAAAVRAGRHRGGAGLGGPGCGGDRPGSGPVGDVGGAPAGGPGAGVAAVRGLEISRLARSNAALARLAEMARLTGTLLIDSDGVYDLADFNDWLVLGLKSTMSQAELHIMAGRLQAAKLAAAGRGELRAPLPVGLVYDGERMVVVDPARRGPG